jgi:signal transduction histidine kinase
VPDPKTKAITCWLPVLLAAVVVIYSEVVNRVYTSEFVVSTVLAISTSLFVLALIGSTWVKWRTPDYYAMVNRLVQKQLARLTVFAAVMAVLLMALEVVTLRLDNTHIGVYKSAELVVNQNKAANRKLVQQVQRILKAEGP